MSARVDNAAPTDWPLTWRLKRSLHDSGIRVQDMAVQLEVHRTTITRWLDGRGKRPSRANLLMWAQVTGFDPDWLMGPDVPAVGQHPVDLIERRRAERRKTAGQRGVQKSKFPPARPVWVGYAA